MFFSSALPPKKGSPWPLLQAFPRCPQAPPPLTIQGSIPQGSVPAATPSEARCSGHSAFREGRSRSPRRERGSGKEKDVRFAQTPESGGAQVVSATDSPDEADWSGNPQDDNDSGQSQLPSHTPRIVGQMKRLISQQAAASSNLDVDRLSSAYEMSWGFDALRKHLTGRVADLGVQRSPAPGPLQRPPARPPRRRSDTTRPPIRWW